MLDSFIARSLLYLHSIVVSSQANLIPKKTLTLKERFKNLSFLITEVELYAVQQFLSPFLSKDFLKKVYTIVLLSIEI